jgi:hypothetical protein
MKIKITLIFCFVLNTSNIFTQNKELIITLKAGNCNKIFLYDDLIDSFCNKFNIKHLYYVKNASKSEVFEFSYNLFNRQIPYEQITNDSVVNSLNLYKYDFFSAIFIVDGIIQKIKPINEVNETDFLTFINFNTGLKLMKKFNVIDSFTLKHSSKIKIPSLIRISENSSIIKVNKYIYITDPVFKNEIYKINIYDSSDFIKGSLKELVNITEIHKNLYEDLKFSNKEIYDSIFKAYESYISEGENFIKINKIYFQNEKIYLLGSLSIILDKNYYSKANFNLTLILDQQLKTVDYYWDRRISYNSHTPIFLNYSQVLSNDSLVYSQVISENNTTVVSKKNLIYKLKNDNNHILQPFKIDSLKIPNPIKGKIFPNVSNNLININNLENPVWFLDPFLYLYYQNDSIYLDLINDTFTNILLTNNLTSMNTFFYNEIYKKDSIIFIVGNHLNFSYFIEINIKQKKVFEKKSYPLLSKYNLKIFVDDKGRKFFTPINSSKVFNYIYFE